MHKTSAWPLALVYTGLIVYASLYPFSEWRYQGIVPWAFMEAGWPKYWTGFDVASNVLGYGPLGFLMALSALRTGHGRIAVAGATALAALLSFSMESFQGFLPSRVPSNVDLGLNVIGAWIGAMLAWGMERLGIIDRWSRFRARWFVAEAQGGLVLLALWPVALLFPAVVPFGLGQVLERVEGALVDVLIDTPFLSWLPVREVELAPVVPGLEWISVTLGLLIPCLLGFGIIRAFGRRLLFMGVVLAVGVGTTALSAALSYGPVHAWEWFGLPAKAGLMTAFVIGLMSLPAPPRATGALLVLALGVYLSLLNQMPTNPYFAQTLSAWEQGRFIRFHGLAQWLGWIWPYAALAYVMRRILVREPKT
ncbi:VanZ family protein [Rhodoferax sp. PAMC 29310]|uniref:VanZ family protein n=1 Tax=Rhodoferax sp. PAMC 29310 TaxID=2822760 RepID=UPI001B328776|nr:VanZ family protein [Rhodoferax sp. PAMC 29310]